MITKGNVDLVLGLALTRNLSELMLASIKNIEV